MLAKTFLIPIKFTPLTFFIVIVTVLGVCKLLNLIEYLPFLLLASIPLFGWAIAWYCWRKRERMVGVAVFCVWLAIVARIHLLPLLLMFLFGESFTDKFLSGMVGRFFIGIGDVVTSIMVLFVPVLIIYVLYAFFKKQFGYVAVALLLVFPAHLSYLESYFFFYPLIDTTKSSRFTLKRFDMIRSGMTRGQVRELIGDPVENAGQYNAPCEGQTGDNAAPPYYDFAWLNSSVCYDESDRVIETKKMWVPD